MEIASTLSTNQSTISRDIRWLVSFWVKSGIMNIDEAKARELQKINKLERTYWEAWEKSKSEKSERTAREKKINNDILVSEKNMKVVDSYGDIRILEGIERCIKMRMAILEIDTKKIKLNDPFGFADLINDIKNGK